MFLIAPLTDVCLQNYDRKKIVNDHRQKYAEITKDFLWIDLQQGIFRGVVSY